eukprot:11885520-Ditylum_brightwellii.AAC.1
MMSEHKSLARIALLEAELTKKDKILREKDKKLAEQEEQTNNLEQENELLQTDQNGSAREKKQEFASKTISILNNVRVRASKGDQKESHKAICKSEPHQL